MQIPITAQRLWVGQRPGLNSDLEIAAARIVGLAPTMTDGGLSWGKTPVPNGAMEQYRQTGDRSGLLRNGCLNDPALIERIQNSVARSAAVPSLQMGTFELSMGDENAYTKSDTDICFSSYCLAAMHTWLRGEYKTIEALNREWETTFAEWADVVPMTRDEVLKHSSWAPWLDHRRFGDVTFARAFRLSRQAVDQQLPGVRCSTKGTQHTEALNGWDWWLLRDAFGALSPYTGEQTIQQGSFLPTVPHTNWIGYGDNDATTLRRKCWNALFHGMARGFSVFSGRNNVNPDLTLPSTATALVEAFASMNQGQARAFFQTRPELDPIALHYSPRSIWTTLLFRTRDQQNDSRRGVTALVGDIGFQYGYVAYEELENGIVPPERCRVLILPGSTAMSDAEADTVRNFVRNGGTLVADFLPAVLTGHGRERKTAALDDVFGVKHHGLQRVVGPGEMKVAAKTDTPAGVQVQPLRVTVSLGVPVTVTDGTAVGTWTINSQTGPALVVNKFGQGTAVYFACDGLAAYLSARQLRQQPRGKAVIVPLTRFFEDMLAQAGVRRSTTVRTDDSAIFPASVYSFTGKNLQLTGLIAPRTLSSATQVTIELAEPKNVYHLLSDKPTADTATKQITAEIKPNDVLLYALLDYRPATLRIETPETVGRGRHLRVSVVLDCETDTPADHVFRMETTDPRENLFPPLTKNVTSVTGKYAENFFVALNERTGEYTIRVRDVITGLAAEHTFEVVKE